MGNRCRRFRYICCAWVRQSGGMGFGTVDGQDPHGRVRLTPVSHDRFKLLDAFEYVDESGKETIPAHPSGGPPYVDGNSTDLATIPWFLTNVLGRYGRQTFPALLHDHECVLVDQVKDSAEQASSKEEARQLLSTAWEGRGAADRRFSESLRSEGASWIRSNELWAGVTLGKYLGGKRPVLLWLMLLHIATGAGPWLFIAAWLGWVPLQIPVLMTLLFLLASVCRYLFNADPHLPVIATYLLVPLILYGVVYLCMAIWLFVPGALEPRAWKEVFNPTQLDY